MASEIAYAWAAGFLDGEGTFGLYACTNQYTKASTRQPVVQAVQSQEAPLIRLALMFGGKVHKHAVTAKGTQMYIWRIGGSTEIVAAIEKLLPHLTCKQEIARVVMEYAKTIKSRGNSGHSESEIKTRETLITEFDGLRMHKVA